MVVRLTGLLAELSDEAVVVERDGLAHEVLVPRYALAELAACRGQTITLHTLEYIEGNPGGGNLIPRLVGFLHADDRGFFDLFTTVKGIGIRKALRALAEPTGRIAVMIESKDAAGLTRLPGIGRRGAEQIIAELHGKAGDYRSAAGPTSALPSQWTSAQRDAIEVLVAWGDARHDAERWVARAGQLHSDVNTADEWVRAAYRIKSGG